jgi:hypothetical protein
MPSYKEGKLTLVTDKGVIQVDSMKDSNVKVVVQKGDSKDKK